MLITGPGGRAHEFVEPTRPADGLTVRSTLNGEVLSRRATPVETDLYRALRAAEKAADEMRKAARLLRRACHDTNSPVVPAVVAEAIARVIALAER